MTKKSSYGLDKKRAISYFTNHIKCGNSFAHKVCEKIDFTKGVFFAKLPQEIAEDQIYNFEKSVISFQLRSDVDSKEDKSIDWACSQFISAFLDERDENCVIIDNSFSDFEDGSRNSPNADVHHLLYKSSSLEEIHELITKAEDKLHFLAVLTELENGVTITDSVIDEMAEETRFVLLSAYNGDGYIIWRRRRPLKLELVEREVHHYSLDAEKTLPYFVDRINCDKTLAKKACEKIDFTKGSFFTVLPNEASLDGLFNFQWSIIPTTAPRQKYFVEGLSATFYGVPVPKMDQETSQFIAAFLAENPQNWAVMEDYVLDPKSPYADIENVKMTPYQSEVYYVLNKDNSLEDIYRAFKKSKQLWRSLTILTRLKEPPSDVLTDAILDEICENAQFVITDAYDGEGDIFWQRKEEVK